MTTDHRKVSKLARGGSGDNEGSSGGQSKEVELGGIATFPPNMCNPTIDDMYNTMTKQRKREKLSSSILQSSERVPSSLSNNAST